MEPLLIEEGFVDPAVADSDGMSRSNFHLRPSNSDSCTVFAKMFLKLLYLDWDVKLEAMNDKIVEANKKGTGRDVKKFSRGKFITAHALLIAASSFKVSGHKLWRQGDKNDTGEDDWASIIDCPGFDDYMKLYRFKQFRTYFPSMFECSNLKGIDPWWQFCGAVEEFNKIRKVSSSFPFLCLFD